MQWKKGCLPPGVGGLLLIRTACLLETFSIMFMYVLVVM